MSDFQQLATACDIALPDLLWRLLQDGKTRYGKDRDDWQKQWRHYTLSAQPALSCVYDFEWIDAQQAGAVIEEWLNPAYQNGRRFLPFAQSGAGDAFCLTPMQDGRIGVALIWHDRQFSEIEDVSFEAFACRLLVDAVLDIEHLLDDGLDLGESQQCVIANLQLFERYVPEPFSASLKQLSVLISQAQPQPSALLTAAAAKAALAALPEGVAETFSITPAWECGQV